MSEGKREEKKGGAAARNEGGVKRGPGVQNRVQGKPHDRVHTGAHGKARNKAQGKSQNRALEKVRPHSDLAGGQGRTAHGGLSERLGLEQAVTGIVGGKTGLLMLLDGMLRAAEEHNVSSFQFYAEIYDIKRKEMGEKLNQYDRLSRKLNLPISPTADRRLYETLWAVGTDLKKMLPPAAITLKELDQWRADAILRIQLCEGLQKRSKDS